MEYEVKTGENQYARELQPTSVLHCSHVGTNKMNFVMDMIARWGVVAAVENGETSTGHPQLRLLTPDELVSRAIIVADTLFERAEHDRSMLVRVPLPSEINNEVPEEEHY